MDERVEQEMKQSTGAAICYGAAMFILIVAIIVGELLWLPAAIKTSSGMQWIEMIDWLLKGLGVIPLLLATGALLRMRRQARWSQASSPSVGRRKPRLFRGLLQWLRLTIIIIGLYAAAVLFSSGQRFLEMAMLLSITVILVFIDRIVSECIRWPIGGGMDGGSRWRFPKRSAAMLAGMAVILFVLLCPTGYLVTYPGMTINMNRYAHVERGETGGDINGVLVFDRPAFIADWLYGRMFPMYDFQPTPEDEPPLTETYAQVVAMKNDAEGVAAAIAMQKAGIGEGVVAEGVRIVALMKDAAALHVLQAGDIIVGMNEQPVHTVQAMVDFMEKEIRPGMEVSVQLKRGEELLTVQAPTAAAEDVDKKAPKRAVFGISVQTAVRLDIPLAIDYSHYIAHVGGPSHGAMLTLAIIDQLTPGGVTGGLHVAGTGTIEHDGSIGLVGGVPQKAYAVSRTDADVFFVPAELEEEARFGAPELNIVPVETIDDILQWLEHHR